MFLFLGTRDKCDDAMEEVDANWAECARGTQLALVKTAANVIMDVGIITLLYSSTELDILDVKECFQLGRGKETNA
jgi:hypothetical protein